MNKTTASANDDIWFRNPMVWLVIAIPGLTVVGCIATIAIALTHPDTLVERSVDVSTTAEQ